MREYLLVVPDLTPAEAPSYIGLAERPVARLRYGAALPLGTNWRSWVARHLGRPDLDALPPAVVVATVNGAMTAAGQAEEGTGSAPRRDERRSQAATSVAAAGAWLATPLHLVAGLDTVHLPRNGIVSLGPDEGRALAESFAATLGQGRLVLQPVGPEAFVLRGLEADGTLTVDPGECLGGDLRGVQPSGPGAAPLRRLMAEIEMWLHEHPVNALRAQRGAPPVRTLWLWGGARPERPATPVSQAAAVREPATTRPGAAVAAERQPAVGSSANSPRADGSGSSRLQVWSDDAWVRALARLAGVAPGAADEAPDGSAFSEPGDLLVTARLHAADGPDVAAFESRHLQPALAALRAGSLGRLRIVTHDRSVTLEAADRYRLWRPQRDWLTALQG